MTSGQPAEVSEPISPELVLVAPPDVARAARERLEDSSLTERRQLHAVVAYPSPAVAEPAPRARRWSKRLLTAVVALGLALLAALLLFGATGLDRSALSESRSLNGSDVNLEHPEWGEGNTRYVRVAGVAYIDGIGRMEAGPSARYISNRIFNDVGQNIFSQNNVSQWGWVWGQFLDHTFGLRNEQRGKSMPIPFDSKDPLERFKNDLNAIDFARTPAAPGTGAATPRHQINTVPSFIDAFAVYGGTDARLEWLRKGPVNGTLSDSSPSLLLPGNYLPRENARHDVASAPAMDLMGPLVGNRANAVVAGDVRANENIALTATHTLFAREHNRIVSLLPNTLSSDDRFQIARRIVGAEQQYITYNEFLPALGVQLSTYRGYDPNVNPSISNEFATVGYRVHSMVHGELEPDAPATIYRPKQIDAFQKEGVRVEHEGGSVKLVIPLDLAFGNPDLLEAVGLGPLLKGLSGERQYRNDEQIDESMRSILFQIPKPGNRDPRSCGAPVVQPKCFSDVQDLGAIDIQRGRDHGIPHYNQLRIAYGLAPRRSYTAITGESTARFPRSRLINRRDPIDDPNILDFTKLKDGDGKVIRPKSDEAGEDVVSATRRTTLAARLRAIYGAGNVNKVDAFVGMLCEPHVRGTEFGQLQLAMWRRQFESLRDGDRFFYLNDPFLDRIRRQYGIDYRRTLANIIRMNTGVTVRPDVFKAPSS
jgi:hypothetical protein